MTANGSGDDPTPTDRPTDVPVVNPAHKGMVRALSTHALVLAEVRKSVLAVRDRLADATAALIPEELELLGREFRRESDTAAGVAREAETAARVAGKG